MRLQLVDNIVVQFQKFGTFVFLFFLLRLHFGVMLDAGSFLRQRSCQFLFQFMFRLLVNVLCARGKQQI